MSYAIRNDGLGWRAVSNATEVLQGETFSLKQPETPTYPNIDHEYKHFAPNDFMALLAPERRAVMAAKVSDVDTAIWYDETLAARYVTYSDERTQAGLAYLLQAGLLTQERHGEIVAAMTAQREG